MRILLIDDDELSRRAINNFLIDPLNHEVDSFDNCSEAFASYQKKRHEVVISDIRMPGMNGIDLLKAIKELDTEHLTEVILITGFGELETSIDALRLGAYDYMLKPVSIKELDFVIKKIESEKHLKAENKQLHEHLNEEVNRKNSTIEKKMQQMEMLYSDLFDHKKIGIFSASMREIVDLSLVFHQHRDINVLIQGDTGTGKEVIARLIHHGKEKSELPFISVNCSAISATLFESELFGYEKGAFTGASQYGSIGKIEIAQKGTLFFDEVADLPLEMQPKLLRVLQEKEFYRIGGKTPIKSDVRFIFATNADCEDLVKQGKFRSDLLYRINTGKIFIPPLRERKTDIPALAFMFLNEISESKGKSFKEISPSALKLLESYEWKGNVRELRSIIERAVLMYDATTLEAYHISFNSSSSDLTRELSKDIYLKLPEHLFPLDDIEYEITRKIIEKFDGNISQASRYLNISWRRLKRLAKM